MAHFVVRLSNFYTMAQEKLSKNSLRRPEVKTPKNYAGFHRRAKSYNEDLSCGVGATTGV